MEANMSYYMGVNDKEESPWFKIKKITLKIYTHAVFFLEMQKGVRSGFDSKNINSIYIKMLF